MQPVEGDILEPLLAHNMISTQTLVVRRDLFLELGCFDEATTPIEDWDFVLRLAARGPIAFVDEPLVHQRFSPNSITRGAARRLRLAAAAGRRRTWPSSRAARDLLARQYYILAGDSRTAGDLAEARRYLALARRLAARQTRAPGRCRSTSPASASSPRSRPREAGTGRR